MKSTPPLNDQPTGLLQYSLLENAHRYLFLCAIFGFSRWHLGVVQEPSSFYMANWSVSPTRQWTTKLAS